MSRHRVRPPRHDLFNDVARPLPDGRLSAMANKSRAKEAALLHSAAILNHQGEGAQPLPAA
jgi:hypothetical protein